MHGLQHQRNHSRCCGRDRASLEERSSQSYPIAVRHLFEAVGPDGEELIDFVNAPSLDAAEAKLRDRGCTHELTQVHEPLVRSLVSLPANPQAALEHIQDAQTRVQHFVRKMSSLKAQFGWQEARCHLALGRPDEAKALMAKHVPMLLRTQERGLVEWFEQELRDSPYRGAIGASSSFGGTA